MCLRKHKKRHEKPVPATAQWPVPPPCVRTAAIPQEAERSQVRRLSGHANRSVSANGNPRVCRANTWLNSD